MVDKFPVITASYIGAIPLSVDASGKYAAFSQSPFRGIPLSGSPGQGVKITGEQSVDFSRILKKQEEDGLNALVGAGILEGMELSQSTNAQQFDIAAGKYIIDLTPRGDQIAVTFPGATAIQVTNPNSKTFRYVVIDRNQAITQENNRPTDGTKLCIGSYRVNSAGEIVDLFQNGERLPQIFSGFADYMNYVGVYYQNLDVKKNGSDGFKTDGGIIYSYSLKNPKTIQSNTAISLIPINEAGNEDSPQNTFNIAFFKKFFPIGGSEQALTGASNFVIWPIYIDIQGNFFLLKPQSEIQVVPGGVLAQGDVLNFIENLKKPKAITDLSAPVSCIIVAGSSSTFADLEIISIRNKLSRGVGFDDASESVPIPDPLTGDSEPLGFTELATNGSVYVRTLGVDGIRKRQGIVMPKPLTGSAYAKTAKQNNVGAGIYWINTKPKHIDNTFLEKGEKITEKRTNIPGITSASPLEVRLLALQPPWPPSGSLSTQLTSPLGSIDPTAVKDFAEAIQAKIPDGTNLWTANSNYAIFFKVCCRNPRAVFQDFQATDAEIARFGANLTAFSIAERDKREKRGVNFTFGNAFTELMLTIDYATTEPDLTKIGLVYQPDAFLRAVPDKTKAYAERINFSNVVGNRLDNTGFLRRFRGATIDSLEKQSIIQRDPDNHLEGIIFAKKLS